MIFPPDLPVELSPSSALGRSAPADAFAKAFRLFFLIPILQFGMIGVLHFRLNTSTGSVFHGPPGMCLLPMFFDSLSRRVSTWTNPFLTT